MNTSPIHKYNLIRIGIQIATLTVTTPARLLEIERPILLIYTSIETTLDRALARIANQGLRKVNTWISLD